MLLLYTITTFLPFLKTPNVALPNDCPLGEDRHEVRARGRMPATVLDQTLLLESRIAHEGKQRNMATLRLGGYSDTGCK